MPLGRIVFLLLAALVVNVDQRPQQNAIPSRVSERINTDVV
ncbi:MAG: hypothetical protein ACREBN_12995 [Burkholderiaceae bacterium]